MLDIEITGNYNDGYMAELIGDLMTFSNLRRKASAIVQSYSYNWRKPAFSDFITALDLAISQNKTRFSIELKIVTDMLGITYSNEIRFKDMFQLDKGNFRRGEIRVDTFIYDHHITDENLRAFSRFLVYNLMVLLGENISAKTFEPLVYKQLQENSIIVDSTGVYKVLFKKLPAKSQTVVSAVNTYLNGLEAQYKGYKSFIDAMTKDFSEQMTKMMDESKRYLMDRLLSMYEKGYKVIYPNKTLYFYKEVNFSVGGYITNGKLYPIRPLLEKFAKFIENYKKWVNSNPSSYPNENHNMYRYVYETFGKNMNLLYAYAKPYIKDILIPAEIIFSDRNELEVFSYDALHVNSNSAPAGTLRKVCIGNLMDIKPAFSAVDLIPQTFAVMNGDSPFDRTMNSLYYHIVYDLIQEGDVEVVDSKETAEFHTI